MWTGGGSRPCSVPSGHAAMEHEVLAVVRGDCVQWCGVVVQCGVQYAGGSASYSLHDALSQPPGPGPHPPVPLLPRYTLIQHPARLAHTLAHWHTGNLSLLAHQISIVGAPQGRVSVVSSGVEMLGLPGRVVWRESSLWSPVSSELWVQPGSDVSQARLANINIDRQRHRDTSHARLWLLCLLCLPARNISIKLSMFQLFVFEKIFG